MGSILLLTKDEVLPEDLQKWICELGGHWDMHPIRRHGVVVRDDVCLYVYSPKSPSLEYDEVELQEIADKLGSPPRTVICVDIGHGEGASEFARELGRAFLKKWQGIIDYNNGHFE